MLLLLINDNTKKLMSKDNTKKLMTEEKFDVKPTNLLAKIIKCCGET